MAPSASPYNSSIRCVVTNWLHCAAAVGAQRTLNVSVRQTSTTRTTQPFLVRHFWDAVTALMHSYTALWTITEYNGVAFHGVTIQADTTNRVIRHIGGVRHLSKQQWPFVETNAFAASTFTLSLWKAKKKICMNVNKGSRPLWQVSTATHGWKIWHD